MMCNRMMTNSSYLSMMISSFSKINNLTKMIDRAMLLMEGMIIMIIKIIWVQQYLKTLT